MNRKNCTLKASSFMVQSMSLSDQNAAERKPDLFLRAASRSSPPICRVVASSFGSAGGSASPASGRWPSPETWPAAAAVVDSGSWVWRAVFFDDRVNRAMGGQVRVQARNQQRTLVGCRIRTRKYKRVPVASRIGSRSKEGFQIH